MKRRLSLAIALLGKPELLILDEPTVGIDPALRKKIWKELFLIRENRVGIRYLVCLHIKVQERLYFLSLQVLLLQLNLKDGFVVDFEVVQAF